MGKFVSLDDCFLEVSTSVTFDSIVHRGDMFAGDAPGHDRSFDSVICRNDMVSELAAHAFEQAGEPDCGSVSSSAKSGHENLRKRLVEVEQYARSPQLQGKCTED